jgi:hypothetical protein
MDSANIQQEINKYKKFKKVDGATYRKVNQFLRKRTYITAREWALARLCTDFRTSGGAEMTFIGNHLPDLVPFMEETYSPQAVNQARNSFKKKVRKSSATFFYGAMCGFFTTDELDDLLFEASEVARFLLEVEGTTLDIDEEIDIEDRITKVMRSVGEAAKTILRTRGEEYKEEDISHDEGLEKLKQLSGSRQCDVPAQQKTVKRKKKTNIVSSQNPLDASTLPEIGEVIPVASETSSITGITPALYSASTDSTTIDKDQKVISPIPGTSIVVPDSDEEKKTKYPTDKTDPEFAGDKKP